MEGNILYNIYVCVCLQNKNYFKILSKLKKACNKTAIIQLNVVDQLSKSNLNMYFVILFISFSFISSIFTPQFFIKK